MKLSVGRDRRGVLEPIGSIETFPGVGERFAYLDSYLSDSGAQPLSTSLPLKNGYFDARELRSYFEGLLPEGIARVATAKTLAEKPTSYLDILQQNGLEASGALVITSYDEGSDRALPVYRPLARDAFASVAFDSAVFAPRLAAESRLSLAGNRTKTGLYHAPGTVDTDGWFLPDNGAPSTHILKFAHPRFANAVSNEALCMTVAKSCGLTVPEVCILPFDQPVLCVERFDRLFVAVDVPHTISGLTPPIRLHQEDLCQAFGVLPEHKRVEAVWGGLPPIAHFLLTASALYDEDIISFLRVLLFNYVIGNCDSHLKDLSILYSEDWQTFSLSPQYDLASTVIYEEYSRTMAMRIGRHRQLDQVTYEDLRLLAGELGLSQRVVDSEAHALANAFEATFIETADMLTEFGALSAKSIAEKIIADGDARLAVLG